MEPIPSMHINQLIATVPRNTLLLPTGELYVYSAIPSIDKKSNKMELLNRMIKIDSPPLICASLGAFHLLGVAVDHTVWGTGEHSQGKSGKIDKFTSSTGCTILKQIHGLEDIIFAVTGFNFSIFLDSNYQVWLIGGIGEYDILDQENPYTPQIIEMPVNIWKISAGSHHCLMLDTHGYVHSFGDNAYGQLGHGDQQDRGFPTKIPTLIDITEISSGYSHNLCYSSVGDVYGFGDNSSHQLGPGSTKTISSPNLIKSGMIGAICGPYYSFFYDPTGDVWVCGDNSYGQFGFDDFHQRDNLEISPKLKTMKIIPSVNGLFAIDSSGNIFQNVIESPPGPHTNCKISNNFSLIPDILFQQPINKTKSATKHN